MQAAHSGFFTLVCSPFERKDAERLVASSPRAKDVLSMQRGGGYWVSSAGLEIDGGDGTGCNHPQAHVSLVLEIEGKRWYRLLSPTCACVTCA